MKQMKFQSNETVLNPYGFHVTIEESRYNDEKGCNEYLLEEDILKIWHPEELFKPIPSNTAE